MDEITDHDDVLEEPLAKKGSRRFRKKWWILGSSLFLVIICVTIALTARVQLNAVSGSISITDARVTSRIDEQGKPLSSDNIFSTQEPRIYCYVEVSAPKAVNIGVRWYRENELIFESREMVYQWRTFYIEPLSGRRFEEGNYRVDVFLINDPIVTIPFTVED